MREVIYFKRPVYVRMLTELAPAAFPAGRAAAARMVAIGNRRDRRKTELTMPGLPPKLVVTTYAPTRRWITIVRAAC